jgi:anion-transporting  ArsA/GET3 family ATPase
MMLDQKGAWDQLVERHAPSPEVRDRILNNRFYMHLSQAFAGSHEYMAIEQLCELHESGKYDLIVVDTPPTRHALDFLEAPQRLADFLDRSIVKWFVRPYFSAGWTTMRFVNRTVGFLFRRLEDATGISALAEVSEFFTSMSGLFENFEERVRRVYELLRARSTGFVLVATPEEQVLKEAEYFCQQVGELGMALRGVVFNRVHREVPGRGGDETATIMRRLVRHCGLSEASAAELAQNFERYEALGRGDGLRMEAFRELLPANVEVVEVPNFNSDVHNVDGLISMHEFLCAA